METKYNIGDRVWIIQSQYTTRLVECVACERTGKVKIAGEEYTCPKCGGGSRHPQHCGHKWLVWESGVIGKFEYEYTDPKYIYDENERTKQPKITYMLDTTGVGSGTLHSEANLCRSHEEAVAECELRTAGKKWEDDK